MAHVRIEGLGPRHGQEDAAEDDEAEETVLEQQLNPVNRRQGAQDRQVVEDMGQTQDAQAEKPDGGDGTEELGQAGGAARLNHEKGDQDAG
ncbi:hypothetical protein D3C80_1158300 [compost metagenome]